MKKVFRNSQVICISHHAVRLCVVWNGARSEKNGLDVFIYFEFYSVELSSRKVDCTTLDMCALAFLLFSELVNLFPCVHFIKCSLRG